MTDRDYVAVDGKPLFVVYDMRQMRQTSTWMLESGWRRGGGLISRREAPAGQRTGERGDGSGF